MNRMRLGIILVLLALSLLNISTTSAATDPGANLELRVKGDKGETAISLPLRIVFLLTFLTLIPALLLSVTSFTRIIIVSNFLRQALGTQGIPNNQILIGLSLFLTFYIMAPVGDKINSLALQPYLESKISEVEAINRASGPLQEFMLKYTREKDIALFVTVAKLPRPKSPNDLPIRVVIPAFIISELKTAFQIGFVLFLPFLVIDMVVSSVLLSMGMLQLPPIVISVPFKILLFIMVDGWNLVIGSLVKTF